MFTLYVMQALSVFSSFIIGVFAYSKSRKKEILLMVIYSFLSLIIALMAVFENDSIIVLAINVFTTFEFILFCFLIAEAIGFKKVRIHLIIYISIYTAFAVLGTGKLTWMNVMRKDLIILEDIFLTIMLLLFYKNLLTVNKSSQFTEPLMFWIFTGGFFYFCLSTPYYIFSLYMKSEQTTMLYAINAICNVTMHCFFIKAFLTTFKFQRVK